VPSAKKLGEWVGVSKVLFFWNMTFLWTLHPLKMLCELYVIQEQVTSKFRVTVDLGLQYLMSCHDYARTIHGLHA
jgi:hypothetical protein